MASDYLENTNCQKRTLQLTKGYPMYLLAFLYTILGLAIIMGGLSR